MQAPTTSADHRGSAPPGGSSYGSNLGRATIVVPKADGDDSNGVPELLRKRLRPTPNKRGGDEDRDSVRAAGTEWDDGDEIAFAADEIVDRNAAAAGGREGHGDWRGERSGQMAPSRRRHSNEGRGHGGVLRFLLRSEC
mmetsp:Transcript_18986/g.45567  ORF Transcript_18986/g.45567 Transcript_18986/m.45567 type:complete len:139 (-) Transcript_18986:406-822(-)